MTGSVRWNAAASCFGFIGTFLLSYPENVLTTALIRSAYSAGLLFLFTFLIRWLLGVAVRESLASSSSASRKKPSQGTTGKGAAAEDPRGSSIDLQTPDGLEEWPSERPAASEPDSDEGAFEPLRPPKLATKDDWKTEDMVQALRRMSEE